MSWIQLATLAVEMGVWADPPTTATGLDNEYIPVVVIALNHSGDAVPLVLDDDFGRKSRLVPAWEHHLFHQEFRWQYVGLVYKSQWDKCHEDDGEGDEDAA